MAFGASPGDVLQLVLRWAGRLTAVGLACGLGNRGCGVEPAGVRHRSGRSAELDCGDARRGSIRLPRFNRTEAGPEIRHVGGQRRGESLFAEGRFEHHLRAMQRVALQRESRSKTLGEAVLHEFDH